VKNWGKERKNRGKGKGEGKKEWRRFLRWKMQTEAVQIGSFILSEPFHT
jgi:hypothetical protein